MKAKIKETGEIVRVLQTSNGDYEEFVTHDLYCPDELVFDVTDKDAIYNKGPEIDYWTRLEHQYAGMAMQGLMTILPNIGGLKGRTPKDEIVDIATETAHALVEKLKKEERK